MDLLTGKQLGPYRVIAPLGAGGMAAVYKAYQPGVDRYVALKILPQHLMQDPQFVARFQSEATIIANLQHPHILPVFDFGTAEGYTYLVMPLIAGGTLAQIIQDQPLPFPQIRHIIAQVGDALDYAHSQGIVHRDVKPSNVLLDTRGNCLLSDFGIAKIVAGTVPLTITGSILGTPAYMSPEQSLGATIDARSDIYALGVVLYELATGQVPFTAETPMAVVLKHIHDPLPPPRTRNPALPEALERIILKALAKEPEDRYQTAGDMVRAIYASEWSAPAPPTPNAGADAAAYTTRDLSVEEAAPTPPQDTQSQAGSRRTINLWLVLGSVGLLLLSLVILGAAFLRPSFQQATNPTTTVLPTEIPQPTTLPIPSPIATLETVLPTEIPQPTTPPIPSPIATLESEWIAIGGSWTGPIDGILQGEAEAVDALYLHRQSYSDFIFAAEMQAVDREASIAFRMQDDQNGYLVIVVPSDVSSANPGIYLAKRVQGSHIFLASTKEALPAAGEWFHMMVQAEGTSIQVTVNGTLVFDLQDQTAPVFTSGGVGFRIYGDLAAPCHANFRNILLPP